MSNIARQQPLEGLRAVVCLGLGPLAGLAFQFDVAFAFGAVAFAVLVMTTLVIYMVRDLADDEHLDLYAILVAAFWVSVAQLIMSFLSPDIAHRMGIYLPCLAASPLILSRVQPLLAEGESPMRQFKEVFVLGLGFWGLMTASGLVREIFSAGTVSLPFVDNADGPVIVPFLSINPVALLATGAGGLIVLGLILALKTSVEQRRAVRTIVKEVEAAQAKDPS